MQVKQRIEELKALCARPPNGPYEMQLSELVCPDGALGKVDTCESVQEFLCASRTAFPALLSALEEAIKGLEKIADPEIDWLAETRPGALRAREALAKISAILLEVP